MERKRDCFCWLIFLQMPPTPWKKQPAKKNRVIPDKKRPVESEESTDDVSSDEWTDLSEDDPPPDDAMQGVSDDESEQKTRPAIVAGYDSDSDTEMVRVSWSV
jgi:hypothetical protein